MTWTRDEIAAQMADHMFFGGLSPADRTAMIEFSHVQTAAKGEILFQTGDRYRGFFLLLEGTVQIYRLNESGRMLVLHVIQPGESFAEVPLFQRMGDADGPVQPGPDQTYPATAETLKESTMLFLPRDAFLSFVDAHPRSCLHMLGQMARRLREAVRRLDALSLQGVKERLAQHLHREAAEEVEGAENGNAVVTLDVPKSVLAAELGTVPETLSRALGDLEDEGVIRREGEQIAITDRHALVRLGRAE